jgi:hypothetical protein
MRPAIAHERASQIENTHPLPRANPDGPLRSLLVRTIAPENIFYLVLAQDVMANSEHASEGSR